MAISITVLLLGLLVVYVISKFVYNVFFHPLRKFPGPIWWGASRLPWAMERFSGNLAHRTLKLHAKYGPVIRIAPDELVFDDPTAWQTIYGQRTGPLARFPEFPKSFRFYRPLSTGISILNADIHEHGVIRRALSHGFSEKAMREQEPIIQDYVNLLIQRIRERSVPDPRTGTQEPIDMVAMYNWCTFDIIGDLAFGDSFGCLRQSRYHTWVKTIFQSIKYSVVFGSSLYFNLHWLNKLIVTYGHKNRAELERFSQEKLQKRIDNYDERPDFLEGLLQRRKELQIDKSRLVETSAFLVMAGSETTATLLSGLTYFLCTNPTCMQKLKDEIRTAFHSDHEVTFTSVNKLPYMLACLDEALRMYPPVPSGLPRTVPPGGTTIAGHWIPEGTDVSVYQWAVNHSPRNWTDPWRFHPERFLGDPRYASDRRDALNPFGVGPRNCIGQTLAYAEMRVILAKLILNFDLSLHDSATGWIRQKVYLLWDKPALPIIVTPAPRRQI